ncbi:MAG: hypothetical protein NTY26_04510 [Burkholderiales bacterium]|nr:hypothetical protein [Burkholderiales bacterium]
MTLPSTPPLLFEASRAIRLAQGPLDIEAAAVLGLKNRLGPGFAKAVELILVLSGRVVAMCPGKDQQIFAQVNS